ncbi:MAG: hypothetical protein CAF44_013280 [Nitrospira sp. CG24D]|nr:MAG: hypothetical protein CAF44_013280 [Nitrospira sp. CG24D]
MSAWDTKRLGDVVAIIGGGTPTRNNPAFYGGAIPWVTPKDMKSWEIRGAQVSITQSGLDNSSTRLVPPNSVLIVVRSGVLKHTIPVGLNRLPVAINQDMKALQCREGVDPEFLAHFIKAQSPIILQWVRATTADNFPIDRLKSLHIPLPPLPEQQRIAEVLDRTEALRAKRRATLAQLNSLTQSIFIDMFGDPATNPKGWTWRMLKDLGAVITGGTPPSAKPGMFDGPIPFITPGDLESDRPVKRSVTEAGANEIVTVRGGAALVCCIGATIGKIGKAAVRSSFNQQVNAVEWGETVNDSYGFAVLHFFKPTIIAWGASTTLPILKKSAFERIEIPVPPIDLQREFARRLLILDRLEALSKASLASLDELFAALQSRAFRGEL